MIGIPVPADSSIPEGIAGPGWRWLALATCGVSAAICVFGVRLNSTFDMYFRDTGVTTRAAELVLGCLRFSALFPVSALAVAFPLWLNRSMSVRRVLKHQVVLGLVVLIQVALLITALPILYRALAAQPVPVS